MSWYALGKIRSATFLLLTHIVLFSFPAHAILDPIDFLALQSIRKSLNDLPGSNYFASWDFTSDPCSFSGVFCHGDKVIALNLGDPRAGAPGLTGKLDPAVGKLSDLSEFTIVPGRIFGPLPDSISQLGNLRFFAVSRNFISGKIPASLGQLRVLHTLDLSFNQLTGIIPMSIGALPSLTNAIFCHNKLSGPLPRFTSKILTRLDLDQNNISGSLPPNSLPPSLQYLSLSRNRLSGPADRILTSLTQLSHLDLSLNQFTGSIPGNLFSFPITTLQLQRNMFYGPVQPSNDVKISTVDLSFNRLSGSISPHFSSVENLYLNNNRFMGEVPDKLVNRLLSGSILTLYLQHNYLTGIGINPTAEIPLSTSICLQYNCMVLPLQTPCPLKSGKQKSRPIQQCIHWKANLGN